MRRVLLTLLVAGLSACQTEHLPPSNTDPDEATTGPIPIGGGATSGTGAASTSSSSGGGPTPYKPKLEELTCADSLAHDPDCEACGFYQTEQFCSDPWVACGDDAYCETGFRTCTQACKAGDFGCLTACFNKKPDALDLILDFNACVCSNCPSICQ
ncbi:MAG: hypothetical protein U0414_38650 [Polyangiaceae bacterium]